MLIEDNALKHWIDHFYGYGSWDARIWFIGHEESGGDMPEDVADKLNYFSKAHASATDVLCDLRELYRHVAFRADGPKADLFDTLYEHRFGSHALQHGLWKNLIAFVHGYRNKKLPDLLTYQKNSLALSSKQSEALIQLFPLPSPHNHAWYYSWLDQPQLGFLKSRTRYEQHLYLTRMQVILTKVKEYKPEIVLMYGMNNINQLKKTVVDFFDTAKFKLIKGTKQQIPQHHRAELQGTIFLITTQVPTLRHNRVETGFDWEEFGKMVVASS
ncbi:hypothetical protein WSM22_42010 [Cytophagales bacterium WSM2-2]|nr:hypothetical protein WSM22_42010 [Cytophagales bacterium WSM2-2]